MQIDWAGVQSSPGAPSSGRGPTPRSPPPRGRGSRSCPASTGRRAGRCRRGHVPGTHGRSQAPSHLPAAGRAGRGWSAFVRAAVARYGPHGDFWADSPDVPRRPIHAWQIWNEENFKYFVVRPSPAEYGRLVERSARAIRSVDRGATIVLGGMFARPAEGAWRRRPRQAYLATDFLDLMYRRTQGMRSRSTPSPSTRTPPTSGGCAPEIAEVRRVLRRHPRRTQGALDHRARLELAAPLPPRLLRQGAARPGAPAEGRLLASAPQPAPLEAAPGLLVLGRRRSGRLQLLRRLGAVRARVPPEARLARLRALRPRPLRGRRPAAPVRLGSPHHPCRTRRRE